MSDSASSTPGGGADPRSKSPASSSKDTKDSSHEETNKQTDSHYGENASRRTPPRADSSDSVGKARPGSRGGESPYISAPHIAHTSQVQQVQQRAAAAAAAAAASREQQEIYEIGSTHHEKYAHYRPPPQGYSAHQRHPMDPHGQHPSPYYAERERAEREQAERERAEREQRDRPGMTSPPGLSRDAREREARERAGFQARAGSPFALVPAGK